LNQLSNRTFDSYNVNWSCLQYRKAKGGRGHGGFFVAKQGLSIKEMLKDPEFSPLAKKIIARLKLIHDTWEKEGLFAEV